MYAPEKKTQRLAEERQAGDSPALPVAKPCCTALDASLIPKYHLWGVRLYVTRTELVHTYICVAFFVQPGSQAE